ncbi:MAG: alpha-galactosidase [Spirochaetes bacterium]|nr:alpha-galactosidase [Spirochaetota bacterium]
MEWIVSKGKKELKIQLKKPDVLFESWKIQYIYSVNDDTIHTIQSLPVTALGKKKITCISSDDNLRLTVVFSDEGDYISIKYTIDNLSERDIVLDKIITTIGKFTIPKTENYRLFKNGYQSWSLTRSYSLKEKEISSWLTCMNILQDNTRNLPQGKTGSFHSTMFTAIGSDTTSFCVIGQGKSFNQYVYINTYSKDKIIKIDIIHDFCNMMVSPASKLRADLLYIITHKSIHDAFERFFMLIKPQITMRKKIPRGWCSWYYYYTKIDEKSIYQNLDSLMSKGKRFDVFQIDDGYQTAVGDWLSINNSFPGGLAPIAQKIRTMGMVPGIWLAPFVASRKSKLYQHHPEWFLHNEDGKPVVAGWNPNWDLFGYFYALDTTHPEFQEYIKGVINTFVNEWGFGYLKLDFVYAASLCGKAFDMSISSAQRLKLGYSLIRDIAGDKVFILGCGAPLSASIGYVDGMRIGPDVAPYWMAKYRYYLTRDPHALCTKFAIRSILNRSQMHRNLWVNDPDCVMLRQTETKLTKEERMTLINAVIITGGMYFISDNLALLRSEDWKLIDIIDELVQVCYTGKPYPVDIMEHELPEIIYNSAGYIAFFNFSNKSRKSIVQLNGLLKKVITPNIKLIDVWGKRDIYVYSDHIDLGELNEHESVLCKIVK